MICLWEAFGLCSEFKMTSYFQFEKIIDFLFVYAMHDDRTVFGFLASRKPA